LKRTLVVPHIKTLSDDALWDHQLIIKHSTLDVSTEAAPEKTHEG